jgi:hypothetical protein
MTKPPANVLDLPLEERAEMALKAAVEKVSWNTRAGVCRCTYGAMTAWWNSRASNCAQKRVDGKRKRPKILHLMRTLRARLPDAYLFSKSRLASA